MHCRVASDIYDKTKLKCLRQGSEMRGLDDDDTSEAVHPVRS